MEIKFQFKLDLIRKWSQIIRSLLHLSAYHFMQIKSN